MLLINQRRVDEVLFANRQKKKFVSKGILILTVVSALISLVAVIYEYFLPLYLIRKYNLNANESSSIGIIGGADGQTAIFVTSKPLQFWELLVYFLLEGQRIKSYLVIYRVLL